MSVRVTWHLSDLPAGRGGVSQKTERRTFHGEDARTLAEHFTAHVVSPLDPDWYRIEPLSWPAVRETVRPRTALAGRARFRR